MHVAIDQDCCQGHGRCYALAPSVFAPDELGQGQVMGDGRVAAGSEDDVRLAAANCPEQAIRVLDGAAATTGEGPAR